MEILIVENDETRLVAIMDQVKTALDGSGFNFETFCYPGLKLLAGNITIWPELKAVVVTQEMIEPEETEFLQLVRELEEQFEEGERPILFLVGRLPWRNLANNHVSDYGGQKAVVGMSDLWCSLTHFLCCKRVLQEARQ